MRLLIPLLLAAAAVILLVNWSGRRADWLQLRDTSLAGAGGGEAASPHDPGWLEAELGPLAPPPPVSVLRRALAAWGPPERVEGLDALAAGTAGAAGRLELQRWLAEPPGFGARALALGVETSTDGGSVKLRAEMEGPPAAVLPWLARILEPAPGRGYLSDPQRVRLAPSGGHELAVLLVVRVVPALHVLAEDT